MRDIRRRGSSSWWSVSGMPVFMQLEAHFKSSYSCGMKTSDGHRGALPGLITIGELAARSGLAASALRFYERAGLLAAGRSAGRQRRYARSVLRRVAFIRAAQEVGLSLDEIRQALASLPGGRTPTQRDWQRLSRGFRAGLEARIQALTRLRDKLSSCIGCGCLSLQTCHLYNRDDRAARRGAGARYLLGDAPGRD
jgi:MerR family redox-sensitive transcriptional activator SoxR